jgi:hypothetical protein
MSISDLELRGVKMPPPETCIGDLVAQQIVEKISSFHSRLSHEAHLDVAPFAETYFLNLIALYPVSMCSRNMTDTLKLVASLFYFGSQPQTPEDVGKTDDEPRLRELFPRNKPSPMNKGYSVEDLALIFDRSPATIAEAVKQKQEEAQVILEEATLRCSSERSAPNKDALETLTEEEKTALVKGSVETVPKHGQQTNLPC